MQDSGFWSAIAETRAHGVKNTAELRDGRDIYRLLPGGL
jgi:hypothetical protein